MPWRCVIEFHEDFALQLRASYDEATSSGVKVRSIAVINPGNPCGSVLDVDTMKDILNFAAEENLVLLADEVYQVGYAGSYQLQPRRAHVRTSGVAW